MNQEAGFTQTEVVPGGLFHQPWWLEAVAPGHWSAVEVREGGLLRARLPYVTWKRYGLNLITRPPLTPTLGPWLEPSKAKQARRLRREKDLIEALLAQLPQASRTSITCQPSFVNVLPFHWAGFDLAVRFTYLLPDLSDMDAIWDGLDSNIRSDIRKAERSLRVTTDLSLDQFLETYEKTFLRQGQSLPLRHTWYHRLDQALETVGRRRMFFAVDSQERVHAVAYLVWDDQRAYYLLGGGDPALRNSGASSLLIWKAIQFSATVSRSFDFEGSMVEAIERFFRGFGAVQTPYYVATRTPSRLMKAASILARGVA